MLLWLRRRIVSWMTKKAISQFVGGWLRGGGGNSSTVRSCGRTKIFFGFSHEIFRPSHWEGRRDKL